MNDLQFKAKIEIKAAAGTKTPTISILAYSGGLMDVPGFGPVVIDLAGLGIGEQTPILADHDEKLSGCVGHGIAEVRGGQLFVEGVVSRTTDTAKQIIQLSKDGFAFEASVGVLSSQRRAVREGETITANGRTIVAPAGGFTLVEAGTLKEVSICLMGADNRTAVSIAASREGKTKMTIETKTESADEIQAVARTEERERLQAIDLACSGKSWGSQQNRVDELRAQAVADEIGIEALQSSLLECVRASRPSGPGIHSGGSAGISEKHIECALLLRTGCEKIAVESFGENTVQQASELRATSLPDLLGLNMHLQGEVPTRRAVTDIKAAFSTVSNGTLLSNVMNKSLLQRYRDTPASWRSFAAVRDATDFKENTSIRPSFVGDAEEVGPGGELKNLSFSESTFTWAIATFGRIARVTRQNIVNDDLSFLSEMLPAMAMGALRRLSDLVWQAIMDSATQFTVGNGNYTTGGASALGLTSLGTAVATMRSQKDDESNNVDVSPGVLVVGPSNEVSAKQILNSTEIQAAENAPSGNALQGVVGLEVEPRLENTDKFTNASATQWFLFGKPFTVPCIVGFLNGQRTPTTEFFGLDSEVGTLGVSWRIYHDFGVALGDFRAGYKSDGA